MIHPEDKPLVRIISPSVTGPWIAGGAPLRWSKGYSVELSDIDVFFKNESQFQELYRKLKADDWYETFTSDNAITMKDMSWRSNRKPFNQTVQLIRKKYYDWAEQVIDSFDLSVCQVAYDGYKFIYGETTKEDIDNKIVRSVHRNDHILKRTIKYMLYGFAPDQSVIDAIKEDTTLTDFTGLHDYDF